MRHVPTVVTLALLLSVSTASAQVPRRPFLFKDARGELAQARARGESDVLLVIASMPGQNRRVAEAVSGMGGKVQFRDDDVDYLRARVPVDRVDELAAHPSVHSVDVVITDVSRAFGMASEPETGSPIRSGAGAPPVAVGPPRSSTLVARPTSSHVAGPTAAADTIPVWPPVLSDYPITNRYSPRGDLRAAELLEANPTYDGRGVKVAQIDMNPDMLLPELQEARALDGTPLPKVVAYGTALDPDEEDDGRWLRMDDVVEVSAQSFSYGDTALVAPRAGTFRIAMFDEAKADTMGTYGAQGIEQDVNRDGNPEGSSRLFAVLWDESTDDVWVDTDQDLDFTDEKALTDFRVRPEFGVFGTDKPDTPVRESIGFGVQIDGDRKMVALNLGIASHASLVVGASVGSRGATGRFDGMAPGAQLISISEGGSAYGQTESTIRSVKEFGADVVYFEQSSLITRDYLLRDGRLVPTVIFDRLVEKYHPIILSPTHNYPILGGIDDFVMARGVIGVNGHEGKDNFFINHGVRVEHDDNLLITGGYGPMGNGALKPDVISPSNYVSTAQGWVEGTAIPGLFQLPPGYTIAGGTSTATPTAAGAVAMLVSAAKQAGVRYDPYRMKYAVTRGARWVDHLPAYKQGNGVLSVAGAWEILKALDGGPPMVEITGRAPIRHPYSHLLATPNEGEGFYERDGWNVGDRGERILTLTRTTGPGGPMTFDVSWAGNQHGTFSAPSTVTLPLNQAVRVPITIAPKETGALTAHFTLTHPDVPGFAYRTLATVVVPEVLDAGGDFTVESKAEVPRPGIQSFFYRVPPGVTAVKFEASWGERAVTMAVSRPDTRAQRGEQVSTGGRSAAQVVLDPMPGVWEVRLTDVADTRTFDWEQAKKDEPVPPTKATLTVTALSVDVGVARGGGEDVGGPGAGPEEVWITNRMAGFDGGAVSTPVASARRERLRIADKEQLVFELEVPPGSAALLARTSNVSDPGADLDVYLFNCTDVEEGCRAARVDGDPVGDETAMVLNPEAGAWKVVVDASDVPSESTEFDYLDAVFNPTFGMVSTSDLPQERARDARWLVQTHTWIAPAVHGDGRMPYAALLIQGRTGGGTYMVNLGELGPGKLQEGSEEGAGG
jgi:hypothetical protein